VHAVDTFLIVTNLFLLIFWVRIWSSPEKELYFNPFLSAPTRFTDRVLTFLHPVLPLPERVLALLLIVFFLAFRGLLVAYLLPEAPWSLTIGTLYHFVPREEDVYGTLLFSILDFLFFIARFWGVFTLVGLLTPIPRRDRATQTLYYAALPISLLRTWLQIVALVLLHGLLVFQTNQLGLPAPTAANLPTAAAFSLRQLGPLTLLSVADSLLMAWQLMFALLVTSLAAVILQHPMLNAISAEGVNTLLGGGRKRMLVGFLDLTPLLYMASLYLLYYLALLPLLTGLLRSL
jgi:hypothetical protein